MKKWFLYILFTFTFIISLSPTSSRAQVNDEALELYPSFRYRSVINTVVISYYKDEQYFLPLNELFSALRIDYNIEVVNNAVIISGNYSEEQIPYRINLRAYTAKFGSKNFSITATDVIIGELDYYFTIDFYKEFFNLDFEIDLTSLSLTLETTITLPIIQQYLRELKRSRAQDNFNIDKKNYPVVFDRMRNNFNGGFLDYNISNSYSTFASNQFLVNNNFGVELMGGDLQGALSTRINDQNNVFETRGLRWRYVIRDNPLISNIELGQTVSDGISGGAYTGIRITNNPVEPRRLFDEYRINGTTTPDSEVELYLNNALIDFKQANDLGNYSFLVPLTYGNSNYNVRIFGPSGSVDQTSKIVQIPFSFLPVGEINYNFNAGLFDNRQIGELDREYLLNGDASIGLTNWLTGEVGAEYYESFDRPTFTSSLSARILSNYLVQTQYASNTFLRTTANVVYPNSSSITATYTNYLSRNSVYNIAGDESQLLLSSVIPFKLFGVQNNIRLTSDYKKRDGLDNTRFQIDTSVRKNRFTTRISYSDIQIGRLTPLEPTATSRITNSYSYSLARANNIPKYIRGVIIRTQFTYLPVVKDFANAQVFLGKSIFNQGNIQFAFGRNFQGKFNTFNATIIFQFNKAISNTNVSSVRSNLFYNQTLRGSVGFDSNNDNFIFTNRQQVGRSAAALRLFVDNNANDIFDEGDEKIEENAVRVDQAGATVTSKDGITYLSQLQAYYKYNLDVIKGNIKNPMLVPSTEKIGFIADPNQFKPIDIPFFMSGVIEGRVDRTDSVGSTMRPVSGLKLLLTRTDGEFNEEIRTFSEGSFYSYEIPPGNYTLEVDSSQLRLLNAESFPQKIDFRVERTQNGDFIEGLSFVLTSQGAQPLQRNGILIEPILVEIRNSPNMTQLNQRYNNYAEQTLRLIIQAQTAYYERDIQRALVLVNESLNLFETAQGYALQGSLHYLNGNKALAQISWEKATEFNPKFYVPDLDILDQIIRTELQN